MFYFAVCPSTQIRYRDDWPKLSNCSVVEGSLILTIGLMEYVDPAHVDAPNVTFPALTEVTDYVLVYRAELLVDLAPIFPNLAVIRGNKLLEVGWQQLVYIQPFPWQQMKQKVHHAVFICTSIL